MVFLKHKRLQGLEGEACSSSPACRLSSQAIVVLLQCPVPGELRRRDSREVDIMAKAGCSRAPSGSFAPAFPSSYFLLVIIRARPQGLLPPPSQTPPLSSPQPGQQTIADGKSGVS